MSSVATPATVADATSKPMRSVDARPVLGRDPKSVWGHIAVERDRLFRAMNVFAEQHFRGASVTRSNPGRYPIFVRLEHWFRVGSSSQRIVMTVTIHARPHRRYPVEYAVEIVNRGRPAKVFLFGEMTDAQLVEIMTALERDTPKLQFRNQLRAYPWEIWRPRNPVVGIRPDIVRWLTYVLGALLVATLVLGGLGSEWLLVWIYEFRYSLASIVYSLFGLYYVDTTFIDVLIPAAAVGLALWSRKRWPKGRRTKATLVLAAITLFAFQPTGWILEAWYGLMVSIDRFGPAGGVPGIVVWLLAAAFIAVLIYDRRRSAVVYNEGRPLIEPRTLLIADYWHTVLDGLGASRDEVQKRFLASFDVLPHADLTIAPERNITLGPDGDEEREHVALSFRRAIVYCQAHTYGAQLYVGWDAYINIGQWKETEIARGMSSLREVLSIRTVEPDRQAPSEYDLHDLNCLIEWVHSRLTKIIREIAAEKDLDQELDFKIQRAERQTLLARRDDGERSRLSILRRN